MGKYFFSHEKSSTCGIFIAFGSKSVTITNEISHNSGHKLVLQVKIDDESTG